MKLLENFSYWRKNFQWPKIQQWRQIFNVSSRKEKIIFSLFCLTFFTGFLLLSVWSYLFFTEEKPTYGGKISLGLLGAPRFFNPVLVQIGDVDQEICSIIFSGLMKYNGQGELVNDLVEKYNIEEEGKVYNIVLKSNVKWHDGQPLNADDIIFTIRTIQNSDFRSPLRSLWQGIETEKIDDLTIRLKLKKSFAGFLSSLTFGILPKHLWENVDANRFALSEQNLKAIGSGPFKIKSLQKDASGKITALELAAFDDYFLGRPYLDKINISFYPSEEEMWLAYKKNNLDVFSFISAKNWHELAEKNSFNLNVYPIILPRYFAIFFNQEANKILTEKNLRQALAYALDKKEIVKQVLGDFGQVVDSPLMTEKMTGYSNQIKIYDFAQEHAKNLLAAAGWQDTDNDQILEKNNQKLEITLTILDRPEMVQIGELISQYWSKIGVKTNLDIKDSFKIQNETIKNRQYQALFFGEILGLEPDLFHFWHSSQKKENGLNLALYENTELDNLLASGREDVNQESRAQKYAQAVNLILEDLPAIFIYNPYHIFAAKKNIQGIELKVLNTPSSRFSEINKWFSETSRSWR